MAKITAKVLNFDSIDAQGDKFPSSVVFIDWKNPVPLTDAAYSGYMSHSKTYGTATLERRSDGVWATMELDEYCPIFSMLKDNVSREFPLIRIYPSINGWVLNRNGSEIQKCGINSIDLGVSPNADSTIEPLALPQEKP